MMSSRMYDMSQWDAKFRKLRAVYRALSAEVEYRIDAPAGEEDIRLLEQELGVALPPSLETFLATVSRSLFFSVSLPEDLELPAVLENIVSFSFELSLSGIRAGERDRRRLALEEDGESGGENARIWHGKLGFISVPQGGEGNCCNVVAFDSDDILDEHRVVFLSRDGDGDHGSVLGENFGEYVENVIAVGGIGTDSWQFGPFLKDGMGGILPDCENARLYREAIGLVW